MKKHELQEIIRQVINELTQPTTIDFKDKNKGDKILDIDTSDISTINKIKTDPNVASATMGSKKLKEMARQPIIYKLTDNYADKLSELPYVGSTKRMVWVNGIIEYIKDNGPSDITKIAREKFNVPQPRISDYARDMIRLGILVPTAAGVVPQFMKPKAEPGEEVESEEETGVVSGDLSDEEIDAMFAKAKASGEESTPEEKPSVTTTISTAKSKAVDFFMDNKNDRLLTKLINTSVASKLRVKEADEPGGIRAGDFNRAEKARKVKAQSELDELILQMADRIKAEEDPEVQQEILGMLAKKLGSVGENMLYKKIAKAVGVQAVTPSSKEDEDVLDRLKDEEEGLDEWLKNKWQYYAGIIK